MLLSEQLDLIRSEYRAIEATLRRTQAELSRVKARANTLQAGRDKWRTRAIQCGWSIYASKKKQEATT